MPCSYEIDLEHRLVRSKAWGVLTGAEIMGHQKCLAGDESFHPDFAQLADFTAVTKLQVDAEMVRQLAARHLYSAGSKRALVVNTAVAKGMVRMFQTYRELAGGQEEIRIFSDCHEALQWLRHDQLAAHA